MDEGASITWARRNVVATGSAKKRSAEIAQRANSRFRPRAQPASTIATARRPQPLCSRAFHCRSAPGQVSTGGREGWRILTETGSTEHVLGSAIPTGAGGDQLVAVWKGTRDECSGDAGGIVDFGRPLAMVRTRRDNSSSWRPQRCAHCRGWPRFCPTNRIIGVESGGARYATGGALVAARGRRVRSKIAGAPWPFRTASGHHGGAAALLPGRRSPRSVDHAMASSAGDVRFSPARRKTWRTPCRTSGRQPPLGRGLVGRHWGAALGFFTLGISLVVASALSTAGPGDAAGHLRPSPGRGHSFAGGAGCFRAVRAMRAPLSGLTVAGIGA